MTLALSERCLADRASTCRAAAPCAWCVSLTLAEGRARESLPKTDLPGNRSRNPQLSSWASLCLPPPSFPLALVSHTCQSSSTSIHLSTTKILWEGGESLQKSALELLLSLPHPNPLFAWGRADSPGACSAVGRLPTAHPTAKEWAHRFPAIPERWGFHTPAPSVCEQRTRGSWQGCHRFPSLLLWTFPRVSRVACICCSLLALSHCLLPQVSGCQCLSPGCLGLCYFVLKPVCFFNGNK